MRGRPPNEGPLLIKRFMEKIKEEAGCWKWIANTSMNGYGRIKIFGKYQPAHRVSWEIFSGKKVPNGMFVCHSCDNPPCVNPAHLWLGTHVENMRDKMQKGRGNYEANRGRNHWRSKITESDVREMRRSFTGKHGQLTSIAKKYGVSMEHVSMIVKGVRWKWVE